MAILEYMYGKNKEYQEGDEQMSSTIVQQHQSKNRMIKKLMYKTGLSEVELRSQRKFVMLFRAQKNRNLKLKYK